MTAPRAVWSAGRRTPWRSVVLALLVGAVVPVGSTLLGAPPADAQPRRVVVLGDSVVLGAQSRMESGFAGLGWEVTFDAAENRSTRAALDAVEAHREQLTDSVVLSFGSNDAGDPGLFRSRVEALLDSVAGVPHVYWLTLREVRDYYGPANQILREAAAVRPNVSIIDWNAASAASPGSTASDGLHLGPAGAELMTMLVAAAVTGAGPGTPQPAAPPPAPTTAAPTTVAPTTAAPTTSTSTTTSTTTTSTTTTSTTTTSTTTTSTVPSPSTTDPGAERIAAAAEGDALRDAGGAVGWTLGAGMFVVVMLLAVGGVVLGGWALAGSGPHRRGRQDDDPEGHTQQS